MRTLLITLAVLAGAATACSRDLDGRYAQSQMRDWYKAQRSVGGAVCCDDADGHPVTEWGRTSTGYWVEFDGIRHDVPPEAIVKGSHPQGLAVVWVLAVTPNVVRCFLPGMEG